MERIGILIILLLTHSGAGERARCAVAANFTAVAKELGPLFEKSTGHRLTVSYGSTGQLYSQIVNGAPFDAFLAADAARPKKLESNRHAVPGTRFTYARGTLVLWSPDTGGVDTAGSILRADNWRYCALANPTTAPYGAAAQQVLTALGLLGPLQPRLVQGTNIAQTWQQVASGNAEIGFVAYSQIVLLPPEKKGSFWMVDDTLYTPIVQQAVLLNRPEGQEAARAFLRFLRGPQARAVIKRYGYGTGVEDGVD